MFIALCLVCLPLALLLVYDRGYRDGTAHTEQKHRRQMYRIGRPRLRRLK